MRADMTNIAHQVLSARYDVIPEIPDEMKEQVVSLAQFIGILRGSVIRDKYTKEITHKSFTELGPRLL